MKVLVTTDAHLYRTPDNKVWCSSIYKYNFWQRYLFVFDEVKIVARVKNVNQIDQNWHRVDGPSVEVFGLPFFQGPNELARKYFNIKNEVSKCDSDCHVVIFRMPSATGQLVYNSMKNRLPFAVEVVFDPTDSRPQKIPRKIINRIIINNLKSICLEANGVSYVTKEKIQRNFPSFSRLNGEDEAHFETYYSSIDLHKEDFIDYKRQYSNKTIFKIVHSNVAMNSNRKGERTLLNALKLIRDTGLDVRISFIGDGILRNEFEKFAIELGIAEYVTFHGLISNKNVMKNILLDSDIYVLPTEAEGLPRGLLEAMSLGLPCVATRVGGIPEILDSSYTLESRDPKLFAELLIDLFKNPLKLESMSKNNMIKASEYRIEILTQRRNEFYGKLKKIAIDLKR